MKAPPSERVVAVGMTGSGKTTLLRELFVCRAPRVLALDVTGEWGERAGHRSFSLDGTLKALEHFARERLRRWTLAAQLTEAETLELAALLVPEGRPGAGLAAAFGGLALLVDEVDLLAPQSAPPGIRALWQRGRHAGLSIYAATQRASACHRAVTSQSQWLLVVGTHEPRDLRYVRELLPADAAAAVDALPLYHAILFDARHRRAWQLDARRQIIAAYGTASAPPTALAPSGAAAMP